MVQAGLRRKDAISMHSIHAPSSHDLCQDGWPLQNQLLAALPAADRHRWWPHLARVALNHGQVLYEPGSSPVFVYFPSTAAISLMSTTRDGASAELAVVGHEGLVGIAVLMGGSVMFSQAVVQAAGQAYRLRAQMLQAELQRPGPTLNLLLRYTQALMVHIAQTALCNRFHSIDQQLCRRLLLGLDRSQSDELAMTQEAAAGLLGVRREGVTAAALKLQRAGVIRYRRGQICVLDRARLEQRACECYASARNEQDRLLPRQQQLPSPSPLPQAPPRSWPDALCLAT
jgi:CRP-like cAMP-binding protein